MLLDLSGLLSAIALIGPLVIAPVVARVVRGRDYDLFAAE